MKILKTFSRSEFILEDDEAENVMSALATGQKGFIKLRSGEMVNTQGIDCVAEVPLVGFYKIDGHEYPVLRDGETIVNEYGNRVKIDKSYVKYLPDPTYKKKLLMLKQKNEPKQLQT